MNMTMSPFGPRASFNVHIRPSTPGKVKPGAGRPSSPVEPSVGATVVSLNRSPWAALSRLAPVRSRTMAPRHPSWEPWIRLQEGYEGSDFDDPSFAYMDTTIHQRRPFVSLLLATAL